jgi:hypothetical protein
LALLALVLAHPPRAGTMAVTATELEGFGKLGFSSDFPHLAWRGGLSLASDDPDFGGLSGLVLGENCEDLTAVIDRGRWFRAKLIYDGGRLAGLADGEMAPILDSKGKPQRNANWADAEALAPLSSGRLAVGFERRVRFGAYDLAGRGLTARFEVIAHPRAIDAGPHNGEVEAFGELPTGGFIAVAERQLDAAGNFRAWLWRGTSSTAFTLERRGDFDVTDLAVLPGGDVVILERRLSRTALPAMAIRRFSTRAIAAGETVRPQTLLEASVPFYAIDNMEGIAVCRRDGETRLTVVSDNNFNTGLQRTLLLQFALDEKWVPMSDAHPG